MGKRVESVCVHHYECSSLGGLQFLLAQKTLLSLYLDSDRSPLDFCSRSLARQPLSTKDRGHRVNGHKGAGEEQEVITPNHVHIAGTACTGAELQ